ncbi:MAG: LysM peptidoglycan-binding domain-containing protein [Rubrobacteraceae bacterium]
MLAVVVLALALYAGSNAGAESPPARYTVSSGETLWGITTEHYPASEDPRPRIEEIREANDLEGYEIQPGMTLKLPAG